MKSNKAIDDTLSAMVLAGGEQMNGQQRLMIRNGIAQRDADRKRFLRSVHSKGEFEWKKHSLNDNYGDRRSLPI